MSLAERRRCVTYLRNEYTVSERRACQVMEMHRSSYRYTGQQELVDLTPTDVTGILDERFRQHGRPACIRSDNGPELVSRHVQNWLREKHVDTHYIDPGSPWQNAYNESFNSIFRTTCLDRCLFGSLTEARVIIDHWLDEYNTVRPHGSLGGMAPEQFLKRWTETNIDQQPKSLTG